MVIVPLQPLPNQTVTVQLNGQSCQIDVYTTSWGLFVDLLVDNAAVLTGVVAENLNRIVRSAYFGFDGDLFFFDTQGASDPTYDGLGSRYQLYYATASELAAAA